MTRHQAATRPHLAQQHAAIPKTRTKLQLERCKIGGWPDSRNQTIGSGGHQSRRPTRAP